MNKINVIIVCILFLVSCRQTEQKSETLNYNVHAFYYNWYGNPEIDGKFYHWNHDILPHWSDTSWDDAGGFPGGNNIGADFYPQLGCYSSNDTSVIIKHMEMISQAGIGVIAITWWGKDSIEDMSVSALLDIAEKFNIKLVFHIEPFYSDVIELKKQLEYLFDKYGSHPALFLLNDKMFYYVYDSYKLDAQEWMKLLTVNGEHSIRNTSSDGTFIGLWVEKDAGDFLIKAGFDGFYTYFASDGFVYGSTISNWNELSKFSKQNDLIFIPCAGPGYIDTRIRPWNSANTKERKQGKYYEEMFQAAIGVEPDFIGITSFNEWHEGTQIEPAISKSIEGYTYKDYGKDVDPMFYINKTKELITEFENNPN